jgi:DNA-binding NarL/FixJ family response regulator
MSIRVLVADDQELVRTGLRMILDAQPDIEVVGEAADGREAVTLARSSVPATASSSRCGPTRATASRLTAAGRGRRQ